HRPQPTVDDVGPNPAPRVLHQLLDLGREGVDEPRPAVALQGVVARVAQPDVALHRLVVDGGELRCRSGGPGEVERLEYLHDLLVLLGHDASSDVGLDVCGDVQVQPLEATANGQTGISAVRRWGDLVSVSGEFGVRLRGVSRGRRHVSSTTTADPRRTNPDADNYTSNASEPGL